MTALVAISCNREPDNIVLEDSDTYPVMKDITGTFNVGNSYAISQGITISSTDVVLVYRDINSNTSAPAVWQMIPKTEYLSGGRELDYNFLFNTSKVEIYTDSNFDPATMSPTETATWLINQRFRVVLIPASMGRNANLDYNDYQSVIRYYNIKDKP